MKLPKRASAWLTLSACLACAAAAGAYSVLDGGSLSQWSEQTFDDVKPTRFEAVFDEELGRNVLAIRSDGSSSGWNYEEEIDLAKTPYLRLRWKVEQIGERAGEPTTKLGDDYPLRIYLHKAGLMKVTLRSTQLVLSPVHSTGERWESPYSSAAWSIMSFALLGGEHIELNKWAEATLDMRGIWRAARDEEPPEMLDGISILGDTDGGKSVSVVYLDNIWFLESPDAPAE